MGWMALEGHLIYGRVGANDVARRGPKIRPAECALRDGVVTVFRSPYWVSAQRIQPVGFTDADRVRNLLPFVRSGVCVCVCVCV